MNKTSFIAALALSGVVVNAASLEEAIKGATIDGETYIRYTSNGGNNDGGRGYASKLVVDIGNAPVDGFSFNTGLYYQHGGTPKYNSNSTSSVNGSRGDRVATANGSGNAFGISTLLAKYEFDKYKTDISFGKMRLSTPITDSSVDRGMGGLITSSYLDNINIYTGFYDSWVADNQFIGGIFTKQDSVIKGDDVGNNLTLIGIDGHYDNFAFKAWYFNIFKFSNSVFGEFSTDVFKDYKITAQVAYMDVYSSPSLSTKSVLYNTYNINSFNTNSSNATSRGLYTLQLSTKPLDFLKLNVGFIGSFGDGYGVSLHNTASFNIAGKWWYDNFGDGRNGFAYSGMGGIKDTHINVWYAQLKSSVSIVDLGLDIVGVSGKNQFAASRDGSLGTNVGNRTFYEVTPCVDLNITKGVKLKSYYAVVFGQVNAQRVRSEISYKF